MAINAAQFREYWHEALCRTSGEPEIEHLRERSLSARVGHHLQNVLDEVGVGVMVDNDYQAAGHGQKPGPWIGAQGGDLPIEVDLLVHNRVNHGAAGAVNFFCAEIKRNARNQAGDVAKVAFLLGRIVGFQANVVPHPYLLGAVVNYIPGAALPWVTSWMAQAGADFTIMDPNTPSRQRPAHIRQHNQVQIDAVLGGAGMTEHWNPAAPLPGTPPAFPVNQQVIP